jgi:ATP-binding cassette subfamily B protein
VLYLADMTGSSTHRDRETARYTHRLFWKANFVDTPGLLISYLARIPANLLYNVLIPVQIAYGIQAIVLGHFSVVHGYAWRVFILSVCYSVLWTIGGFAIAHNAIAGSEWMQRKVFENYLSKDYDFYSNTYFGALSAQANRLRDALNEYGQMVTLTIPKQLTIIVAGILVIGYHSALLALITITTVALILAFTLWSSAWRLKYRRLMSEASSELAGVVGDALSHGPTVKSFAAESYEQTRLESTIKKWSSAQFNSWVSSLPADAGRMVLAAIATAVLLVFTSRLYQQHVISIAIVALAQLYVVKMVSVTQDIAEIIKSYEQIMSGAYQPVRTMLIEQTVLDKPQTAPFPNTKDLTIEFSSVDFTYQDAENNVKAISDFSLKIEPGEKVGIVGYSGSGKTTLTKLLLRYMDSSTGSISINDVAIVDMKQTDLRGHISYVPQEPLLFHRSIAENIAYGKPRAGKKAIDAAAKAAYVDDFVDELPKRYNTLVGEHGIKLSGGQRQRVAIARAILKDAPILVLDEATSALDSRSEKFIQKALWHLMEGRSTLVIAHRLSTIQHMDRIIVMDRGHIVQVGSHAELLKQKRGIYAKLWEHQSGGYIGIPTTEVPSEVA